MLINNYKEIIGRVDEELDKQVFTDWCKSIGLKDTSKVHNIFKNLDTDHSGKIGFYEFT